MSKLPPTVDKFPSSHVEETCDKLARFPHSDKFTDYHTVILAGGIFLRLTLSDGGVRVK